MAQENERGMKGLLAEERAQAILGGFMWERQACEMLKKAGVPFRRAIEAAPEDIYIPGPEYWNAWNQSTHGDFTASEPDISKTRFLAADFKFRGSDVGAGTLPCSSPLILFGLEGLPPGEFVALVPQHVWSNVHGWDRGFNDTYRRRNSSPYTWSRWAVSNGFQVHRTQIKEAIWSVLHTEEPYFNPTTKLVIQPQDWPGRELIALSTLPLPQPLAQKLGTKGVLQLHRWLQESTGSVRMQPPELPPFVCDCLISGARVEVKCGTKYSNNPCQLQANALLHDRRHPAHKGRQFDVLVWVPDLGKHRYAALSRRDLARAMERSSTEYSIPFPSDRIFEGRNGALNMLRYIEDSIRESRSDSEAALLTMTQVPLIKSILDDDENGLLSLEGLNPMLATSADQENEHSLHGELEQNGAGKESPEGESEADNVECASARLEWLVNSRLVRSAETPDTEDRPSLYLISQPPGHPDCTHVCVPLQLTAEEKERFHREGVPPYPFSPGMADISGFPVNLMLMRRHGTAASPLKATWQSGFGSIWTDDPSSRKNCDYIEILPSQWTSSRTPRQSWIWGYISDNEHLFIPSSQTRYHENMQLQSAPPSPLPYFLQSWETLAETKERHIPLKDFLRGDYEKDLCILRLQDVADKLAEEMQKLYESGNATVKTAKLRELTQAGWDLGLSIPRPKWN